MTTRPVHHMVQEVQHRLPVGGSHEAFPDFFTMIRAPWPGMETATQPVVIARRQGAIVYPGCRLAARFVAEMVFFRTTDETDGKYPLLTGRAMSVCLGLRAKTLIERIYVAFTSIGISGKAHFSTQSY